MDVGEHAAGRDGDRAEELVELFVVADRELEVAGDDAGLLVVASRVTGEFEDLGAEIFEDRGEVDGSAGTHAGAVLALLEVAADTADGELETSLGGLGGGLAGGGAGLALAASSFTFARHVA